MTKVFNKFGISLLLLASSGSVFANPDHYREWRDGMRFTRQQQTEQQGSSRGDRFQYESQRGRSSAEGAFPPAGMGNGQGVNNYGAPDASRKPGRMSPEERRALRRQINEVGRDIYAPH